MIGFPHGGQSRDVINTGALINEDHATIEREVALVVGLAHASEALVKG